MLSKRREVKEQFKNSDKVLRITGLFVPLLMILYGFLVKFGIIYNPNYTSDLALYIISATWIVVAILQLPFKKQFMPSLVKVILYHILTMAYFIFISGFDTPFVAVWVLNMIDTLSYFSIREIWVSLSLFIIAAIVEVFFVINASRQVQINQLVSIISVSVLGTIIILVVNSRNIDQAELEKDKDQEAFRRQRLLTIINSFTDSLLGVNSKGDIDIFNSAALNIINTNENLIGQNIGTLFKIKDESRKNFNLGKTIEKTKSNYYRNDLTLFTEDEEIKIELRILPVHTSFSTDKTLSESFVILIRDITKEKSLEEERDEFISVVSHELRTPVAIAEGAIGNLDLMLEHNIPKSKMHESIESAHSEVIFLANMINDLSTLSRTERGIGDNAEIIDVQKLGENIFERYKSQAEKKGLQLDLDLSPDLGKIKTSRLYIEELLQNFMTNAIKYTKTGNVVINFKNLGDEVCFSIIDSGIGMTKADQQKVFDKFFRSEDYRTRETGGTGLGLYVSRKLAEKMGTEIEVKSRLNHGSTFSFIIPKVK